MSNSISHPNKSVEQKRLNQETQERFVYRGFTENPATPFYALLDTLQRFRYPENLQIHTCTGAGWPIVFALLHLYTKVDDLCIYHFDNNPAQIEYFISQVMANEDIFNKFWIEQIQDVLRYGGPPVGMKSHIFQSIKGYFHIDIVDDPPGYLEKMKEIHINGETKRILFLSNILDYYHEQHDQSDQYISSLSDLITTYLSVFDAVIITTHPAFEGKSYQVDYLELISELTKLGYIVHQYGLSDSMTIVIEKPDFRIEV